MFSMIENIGIGCDHAGYAYKEKIKNFLEKAGIKVTDFGTHSEESVDYPDFIHPLAKALGRQEFDYGIVICGSGNGVNITANKYQYIRSALCWNEELAKLARNHNDANVLALPARFISYDMAKKIVKTFFNEEFEAGRHQRRVEKIKIS